MITMAKTQGARLHKWCWQQSRVYNIQPEVNNNYDKELIFYADFGGHSWHTNKVFFKKNLDSWTIFGNSYCENCSETIKIG